MNIDKDTDYWNKKTIDYMENNKGIVWKYVQKYIHPSFTIDDLYQESFIIINKYLRMYHEHLGFNINTYIGKCLDKGLNRVVEEKRDIIRIPTYVRTEYKHCLNNNTKNIPTRRVNFYSNYSNPNETLSRYDKAESLDMIHMNSLAPKAENLDICIDYKNTISKLLSNLNDTQRYIIVKWYGLEGQEKKTLKEIGKELNISYERVAQLRDRALKLLKSRLINRYHSTIGDLLYD